MEMTAGFHFGKSRIFLVAVLVLAVISGFAIYRLVLQNRPLPVGLLQTNGRIEGDHQLLASKASGRINRLLVKEGDEVRAGQVLARLDDAQVRARRDQAQQAITVLDHQINAAESSLAEQRKEVPINIAVAQAALQSAQHTLDKARAAETQASLDVRRYRQLVVQGFISRQRTEQADLAVTSARNDRLAAQQAVVQAQQQLAQARLGWSKLQARADEIAAQKASRDQARAVLREAQSAVDDLVIRAPANGTVVTRIRDIGEVVTAGEPVFDLVNLDRLYLQAYIPEAQIGKLRLHLPARIYTDAFPDQPFDAEVGQIASRAEFTPKEVQTPDERVKLVYAVKLYLVQNPQHRLTPGMPADAMVRWKDGVPWQKPRW